MVPFIGSDSKQYAELANIDFKCNLSWRQILFIDDFWDNPVCVSWGWYLTADF